MPDMNPPASPEDVQAIMDRVLNTSRLIATQQAKADLGQFKDMGAALGLQKLRQERKSLQARLPKLALV